MEEADINFIHKDLEATKKSVDKIKNTIKDKNKEFLIKEVEEPMELVEEEVMKIQEVDVKIQIEDNSNVSVEDKLLDKNLNRDKNINIISDISIPSIASPCDTVLQSIENHKDIIGEPREELRNDENSPPNENIMRANSQSHIPVNIPSPFKRSLFWPETTKTPKLKRKEKIPSVANSKEWKEYHRRKVEEKAKKKKDILERKKKRLERIENMKKEKRSNNTRKQAKQKKKEEIISKEVEKINKDDYVIVMYEDAYYPGKVLDSQGSTQKVTVFIRSGAGWKWSSTPDTLWLCEKRCHKKNCAPKKS